MIPARPPMSQPQAPRNGLAADLRTRLRRVVPDAELMTNATTLAEEIAQGPTLAYRGVKRLMLESATSELDEQMGRETETICATSMTRDAREGIAAFLAKRPPKFAGQ